MSSRSLQKIGKEEVIYQYITLDRIKRTPLTDDDRAFLGIRTALLFHFDYRSPILLKCYLKLNHSSEVQVHSIIHSFLLYHFGNLS